MFVDPCIVLYPSYVCLSDPTQLRSLRLGKSGTPSLAQREYEYSSSIPSRVRFLPDYYVLLRGRWSFRAVPLSQHRSVGSSKGRKLGHRTAAFVSAVSVFATCLRATSYVRLAKIASGTPAMPAGDRWRLYAALCPLYVFPATVNQSSFPTSTTSTRSADPPRLQAPRFSKRRVPPSFPGMLLNAPAFELLLGRREAVVVQMECE
ncbi:hypothetical protein B0H19DRAFT_151109 [Mycena capillaripes]|nr:hypothetical protein B0H19DRAFT_151109 [Mycena capillaripes]